MGFKGVRSKVSRFTGAPNYSLFYGQGCGSGASMCRVCVGLRRCVGFGVWGLGCEDFDLRLYMLGALCFKVGASVFLRFWGSAYLACHFKVRDAAGTTRFARMYWDNTRVHDAPNRV